jgi:hypothetical protein
LQQQPQDAFLAGAFLATAFLAGAFLATFLTAAVFFAGAFLTAFFATFLATVVSPLRVHVSVKPGHFKPLKFPLLGH